MLLFLHYLIDYTITNWQILRLADDELVCLNMDESRIVEPECADVSNCADGIVLSIYSAAEITDS